jgi:4-aminobutyrate aminotransferase
MLRLLQELREKYEFVGDVRGKGMLIGVELRDNRKSRAIASEMVGKVIAEAFHRGLLITPAGIHEQVLRISPPLNLTMEEAELGIHILEKAMLSVCDR